MRKVKIVTDSSANLLKLEHVDFASAPLKENGLVNGKVHLAHCRNLPAAEKLKTLILEAIPGATVTIGENLGLCSYYVENGGVLVGYEKM